MDLILERADNKVVRWKQSSPPPSATRTRFIHLRWLAQRLGPDLLDAAIVTTGRHAYRRTEGIAVIPLALLGP